MQADTESAWTGGSSSDEHGSSRDSDNHSECIQIPVTESSSLPNHIVSSTGRSTNKRRNKSSWVFQHFAIDENCGKRRCAVTGCKSSFSSSTATGTLARHLQKSHRLSSSGDAIVLDPLQTTFNSQVSALVVSHHLRFLRSNAMRT